MTALPHRSTTETVWERQSGDIKLLLESGRTSATNSVGLPYGSVARMILLYLQTEAVRTRSREVELGRSMNSGSCSSPGMRRAAAKDHCTLTGSHFQHVL